ncbi:MAG TPA: hypothetical protein VJT73_02680 [Polyangiaceae bacterium]|nr:hypothetical protein [Polyangiaceae bacterium]
MPHPIRLSVDSRVYWLLLGASWFGCGGSDFVSTSVDAGTVGIGGSGLAGHGGTTPDDASASDSALLGSGGGGGSNDASLGSGGKGGGGAAGMSGGGGTACPPCAAPPDPACNGQGICGCGPYVCPDAGKDAAKDVFGEAGPSCGVVTCQAGQVCCNPLRGICTAPGQSCIL